MSTKIFDFQAALKAKNNQQPVQAVEFIKSDHSEIYYPEMGERRNPTKPILGEYCYKSYEIKWAVADNDIVLGLLKQFRIRPVKGSTIELKRASDLRYPAANPFGNSDYYNTLITCNAYRKLREVGVVCTQALLD